ncbi:glycerotoxin paralog 1 [Penaeus vannamei]|uniref:glycerotoxin paralog 1 n=1 Tax=Penaeus vannamei TaxID=6689 RepID=UPI00387FA9B9
MKDDGQSLANNIISFSKLILDIRDEEGNLKVAQLAVDQGGDRLAEVQGMLSDTETTEENYKEKMARQNLVLMNLMYDLYRKTRKDMVVMKRVLGEFCQAYFYTFFLECPDDLRPRPSDDYDALLYKFSQLQFESLNSVGTLDPPPQPFAKTLLLTDQKENCTARDPLCPVTTLRQQGTLDVDFSDWWGSELLHKDRVRVDRVRLYLRGTGEDFVVLQVTQPAVFNDTYLGQVYTFLGPASQCFVMYEDSAHASMGEASYVTDCSTHANYDRFYSRATPFGSYTVTPVGETVAAATSAVEVLLEGSWMPRTKVESAT